MNLSRLVYYSERNSASSLDLRELMAVSHRNNSRDSITGFLFFNGTYFIQILEGGRTEVSATYHRIAGDNRHGNVLLINFQEVRERYFPTWSMGLQEGMDERTKASFLRYFATDNFDPETVNVASLVDVMQDLSSSKIT